MQKQEPGWPALLALFATAGLHLAMPEELSLGPRWLLMSIVAAILIPVELLHSRGNHKFCRPIGWAILGVVTLSMVFALVRLVMAIPDKVQTPVALLCSAICLWITNIFIFAVWYWRIDAGGPHKRSARGEHTAEKAAFLFPQMSVDGMDDWTPKFIDYVYLAFNTSTALSPTDAPVLSRTAKVLMMIQASISLTVIVLMAARAVNIL